MLRDLGSQLLLNWIEMHLQLDLFQLTKAKQRVFLCVSIHDQNDARNGSPLQPKAAPLPLHTKWRLPPIFFSVFTPSDPLLALTRLFLTLESSLRGFLPEYN